jgi:hypothetical protein
VLNLASSNSIPLGRARARHRQGGASLTQLFFDHDRLDVYRLSIEYIATEFDSSRSMEGLHPSRLTSDP